MKVHSMQSTEPLHARVTNSIFTLNKVDREFDVIFSFISDSIRKDVPSHRDKFLCLVVPIATKFLFRNLVHRFAKYIESYTCLSY